MQSIQSKKFSIFSVVVLLSVSIATILSVIFCSCLEIFSLNENQLLYLFSAMAQVIGSVFGLTLTAYIFFMDKFKDSSYEDETLYDAVSALLDLYFHDLAVLAALCGTVILISVLGIICLYNCMEIYSFVINEAVLLFLIGITAILIFGVMLLDPKKLNKELKRMKENAEKSDPYAIKDDLGDFTVFLKTYNMLERLIKDFAELCMDKQVMSLYNTYYNSKTRKPQIIQALETLNRQEIIGGTLLDEINTFRIYRNGLVHGVDFNVTKSACDRILEIYDALKNAYDVFELGGVTTEEWQAAIRKVYDLSR